MDGELDFHTARAMLEWQIELGATEAISDMPVNRYDLAVEAARPAAATSGSGLAPHAAPGPAVAEAVDPVAISRRMAMAARDLPALREALAGYEHCDLKRGARNLVFADGNAAARLMIVGEAPGRDEDLQGFPFVGRAGQLLDRMFGAIGLSRKSPDALSSFYITNIMPWRPPQNRDPQPDEIAMMLPFITRHIELAAPDVIVLMGNISCQALLGQRGITRLRGNWAEVAGRPTLPMFHPAYLLRNPHAKREAWHDLLLLQSRLRSLP